MVVAKQKITLSKDPKKKKRLEVIQHHSNQGHHSSQAQGVNEEDENGYVSRIEEAQSLQLVAHRRSSSSMIDLSNVGELC